MPAETHAALATAVLALSALACRAGSRSVPDAGAIVPSAEAAKLVPFLPARLGSFTATRPATSTGSFPGPHISATREYASPDGRNAHVRISTGDVRSDLATLDSDQGHAFGSDTPTYWRTTSIAGHRTRVAEERPVVRSSECLVRASDNHVAAVRVTPAGPGDCETVAIYLDFTGIAATGGVPGPSRSRGAR